MNGILDLLERYKRGGKMKRYKTNKEISEELKEALERCKIAQKQLKKRQQKYCIEQYYKKKETEQKRMS